MMDALDLYLYISYIKKEEKNRHPPKTAQYTQNVNSDKTIAMKSLCNK
jgi:hypothetical protein